MELPDHLYDDLKRGEPRAQEILYQYFSTNIQHSLVKKIGFSAATEVSHNAFLKLFVAIAEDRVSVRQLRAVCWAVARNEMIDFIRRETPVEDPRERIDLSTPEKILLHNEKWKIVKQRFGRLCPLDQEIIRRFYFDGDSEEKIRTELQLSFHCLKNRKHRALKALCQ